MTLVKCGNLDYHVSLILVKCDNFDSVSVSMILLNFTMSSSNRVVHSSSCSFLDGQPFVDLILYTRSGDARFLLPVFCFQDAVCSTGGPASGFEGQGPQGGKVLFLDAYY